MNKKEIIKILRKNFTENQFDFRPHECHSCPISNKNTDHIWGDIFCENRIASFLNYSETYEEDDMTCTERIAYFKKLVFHPNLMETE